MPPPGGPPPLEPGRFQGRIRRVDNEKGFGFIECREARDKHGRDVFIPPKMIGDLREGDEITFVVDLGKDDMPQAGDLRLLDGSRPGPGAFSKGGGKGKDRDRSRGRDRDDRGGRDRDDRDRNDRNDRQDDRAYRDRDRDDRGGKGKDSKGKSKGKDSKGKGKDSKGKGKDAKGKSKDKGSGKGKGAPMFVAPRFGGAPGDVSGEVVPPRFVPEGGPIQGLIDVVAPRWGPGPDSDAGAAPLALMAPMETPPQWQEAPQDAVQWDGNDKNGQWESTEAQWPEFSS